MSRRLFASAVLSVVLVVVMTWDQPAVVLSNHDSVIMFEDIHKNDPLLNNKLRLKDMAFMHIPKAGGAFVETLAKKMGFNIGGNNKTLGSIAREKGTCNFWHIPTRFVSTAVRNKNTTAWAREWMRSKKFTVVRNPASRLISEYNFVSAIAGNRITMASFTKIKLNTDSSIQFCQPEVLNDILANILDSVFLKNNTNFSDCHYIPQVDYIFDESNQQAVDYVLRLEDLSSQITTFFNHLGVKVTSEHVKASRGNHGYPECPSKLESLNNSVRKRINTYYSADFRMLGYPHLEMLPENNSAS